MADILIQGMEMPKNEPLTITITPEGKVFRAFIPGSYGEAVSLPEGHGRLIDANAIVAEMEKQETERDKIMELCKRVGDMKNYFRCSNNQTEIVSFIRMLNNAPTIVPAEGGNDDG